MKLLALHLPITPLPAGFLTSGAGLDGLEAISIASEFRPGSTIFLSNCTADAIWTVTEGSVLAIGLGTSLELGSGEGIYGLTETLAGTSYRSSLYADTACRCTSVFRDDLIRLLRANNGAALLLLERLAGNYLVAVAGLAGAKCNENTPM